MNGDEDLGQDITMKGEKFHYGQQSMVQLPKCDGSNGVVGLDCQSVYGYPKKTAGRPWGPMNDAYPEGFPRYASRIQLAGEDDGETPKRNNSTDEDDTAKETPLPVCDGKNGIPKVDCRKPKPL